MRRTSLVKYVEIRERIAADSSIVAGSAARLEQAVVSLVLDARLDLIRRGEVSIGAEGLQLRGLHIAA